MSAVTIESSGGLLLEGRWDLPMQGTPHRVTVVCHPHPLQGGTMDAPLIRALTGILTDRGHAVLRFNFRGVGASEGSWGEGITEQDDVAAAVATAARAGWGSPLGVVGWSFGAVTSLRWQFRDGSTLPWVGIAPPVRLSTGGVLPEPQDLPPARRLFLLGDRDQYTPVEDLRRYAEAAGGEFALLPGSDHFFHFREPVVGGHVVEHFSGEIATRSEG
jgi:alpha/beta superfamily hydrolase